MPESYTYRYPNQRSYALLPVSQQHDNFHWQGRSLRHGYIYGYKSAALPATATGTVPPGTNATYRQVNFANYKMFQFNPAALGMSVQMMTTEDKETQASGGALPSTAVGLASTSLELFFDRTEEIARSNKGIGDEIWRDLGVQVDLFDFLMVISGGDTSMLGTFQTDTNVPEEGWGSVQKGSMNQLSGMLFDSAIASSAIMFKPFAIVFNPNLTMHIQQMTSFAFTYVRFTPDLVPTTVKLEITVQITNMGTKSYATSINAPEGSVNAPPPSVQEQVTKTLNGMF
jgi:hypothetical protein